MYRRMLADLKKYFGYSVVYAAAQLRAEVASSYLNWLWWILNPVCFMLIYTFMFGSVFNSREPYFPIFIFIGLSMWDFFSRMMTQSVKLVKNNKPIVTKVYLPKYILVLTRLWINGFKMMISFGVAALMIVFARAPLTWNAFYFFPVLLALAILTFGLAVLVMHYGVQQLILFHKRGFTSQIPERKYRDELKKLYGEECDNERFVRYNTPRLQEGIVVIEKENTPVLLVDDSRSIMSYMYGTVTYILREYFVK